MFRRWKQYSIAGWNWPRWHPFNSCTIYVSRISCWNPAKANLVAFLLECDPSSLDEIMKLGDNFFVFALIRRRRCIRKHLSMLLWAMPPILRCLAKRMRHSSLSDSGMTNPIRDVPRIVAIFTNIVPAMNNVGSMTDNNIKIRKGLWRWFQNELCGWPSLVCSSS